MSQLTSIPPGYVLTGYVDNVPQYAKAKRGQLPPEITAKSVMERQTDNRIYREKPKAKPRIRQSSQPLMNKLEIQYHEVLKARHNSSGMRIVPQGMRVKIAGSAWYKVDFYIPQAGVAYEVKGPRVMKNQQSRQMLALKVAANQWPEIIWYLCYKEGGEWKQELVRP